MRMCIMLLAIQLMSYSLAKVALRIRAQNIRFFLYSCFDIIVREVGRFLICI